MIELPLRTLPVGFLTLFMALFRNLAENQTGEIKVLAIKGLGRPTRLLPHAKMLLIPIKMFLSAG